MRDKRFEGMTAGVIMVIFGVWSLATQFVGRLSRETIPLLSGLVFLALHFCSRTYGSLVASGTLSGVGLGRIGKKASDRFDGLGGEDALWSR